jgi:hypothetical protein
MAMTRRLLRPMITIKMRDKAAAIGWSRGWTTRSQKWPEQRTISRDRSPSKLPGTSIYREVSSIKVNASLKTHGPLIDQQDLVYMVYNEITF